MAVAYTIVKNHGGQISVDSREGEGTGFSVYFPASDKSAEKITSIAATPKEEGKILVMDDERIILQVSGKMIEDLGYEVEYALNGDEAIQHFSEAQNSGTPFDAVIMDITIRGGMGGEDTLQRLIGIDPEVNAIASSGYTDSPILSDFKKYGFNAIINKPYTLHDLSHVLHKTIDARRKKQRREIT